MISDKTFVATGKWLEVLKKDASLFNFMGKLKIKWRFNLPRAPWWGGFFERPIGVMKRSLSKSIGRSLLKFAEIEEALIDVEASMKNRPLLYQGEEFEKLIITSNILLRRRPLPIVEDDLELIGDEAEVSRRMKLLQRSKHQLRQRFMNKYIHALEERQQLINDQQEVAVPEPGSILLLKGKSKQKAHWKLGTVLSNITGKNGIVRGLKLKLGDHVVERPLQLVCDLEIGGKDLTPRWIPNPDAADFVQERTGTGSKGCCRSWIKDILADEGRDI